MAQSGYQVKTISYNSDIDYRFTFYWRVIETSVESN